MAGASSSEAFSRRAWQHYWQADRIAACMPDNPAAAAAIERHWKALASPWATGTRVLDVATGNGVLLLWAAQVARENGAVLELTGIDAARIDPLRHVASAQALLIGVDFRGGVGAEDLPFADASFDCVISQFGLEYSDLDASVAEVARVLAPGGVLHWLAHSGSSAVVAESAAKVAQMDFLLAREGPFDAMAFFSRALQQKRRVARARAQLQAMLDSARAYCEANPPGGLVQQICGSFANVATEQQRYDPRDIQAMVEENREKMRLYRRRLRDLLAAQLTPERERGVAAMLAGPGWQDLAIRPLAAGDSGEHLGSIISATRR